MTPNFPPTCVRLSHFDYKTFPQLFDSDRAAQNALLILGFKKRRWRWGATIVLTSLILGLLAISFVLVFVKEDKCYALKGEITPSEQKVLNNRIKNPPSPTTSNLSSDLKAKACLTKAENTFVQIFGSEWPQTFSGLGIAAVLFLTVYQWERTRGQSAFSEAFARKVTSNRVIMDHADPLGEYIKYAQLHAQVPMDAETSKTNVKVDVFIYMEMDNLEYAFEKYRDREISAKSTLRQIFIFVSRCGNPEFRNKAIQFSDLGFYRPEFSVAIKKIVEVSKNVFPQEIYSSRAAETAGQKNDAIPPSTEATNV